MSKRKYTKKSDYWNKFNKGEAPKQIAQASFQPSFEGEPFYVASASEVSHAAYSRTPSRNNNQSRINRSSVSTTVDRFSSIRSGLLPYEYTVDGVNVREAILLCQKAYANVAVFRNAVDIMSEFAHTEVFLEGGTKKSREFFKTWFKKINLWHLADQYFREYYRSGNVFLFRIEGDLQAGDLVKLAENIGTSGFSASKLPIKYALLNPYDVVAKDAVSFSDAIYAKLLSKYELARLKNPQTPEDQAVFDGLPADAQEKLRNNSLNNEGLLIPLDPKEILFSFYKKQDYEPFAIPFGFSVLEDINAKMELKKMDQAITRTVENVILLITMGAEPEKGGINPANLNAMQTLFKNESVGRVLVSDYTTKAEFIIPDLNKVLGYEKYKILNEDIKQGLQNIVVGEEKFSSTQVKAQIFVDRLKEARHAFINDFLQKEIKRVANILGMKSYPQAYFKDIDMRDQSQLMRVTTRLMELGVITPQQGMDMFENGVFPKAEDILPAQEEFVKDRTKGYYNPIVGGIPTIEPAGAEANRKLQDKKDKQAAKVNAQATNQTPKTSGRPEGTTGVPLENSNASYSRVSIGKTIYALEDLNSKVTKELKNKLDIKRLSKQQKGLIAELCEAVACASEKEKWEEIALSCVKDFNKIEDCSPMEGVLEIAATHDIDTYSAAILYHSQSHNE